MATCKDCIHERVCFALIKSGLPYDDLLPAEAFCMTFKSKADFVEVVRCCECKYKGTSCRLMDLGEPNDFCSLGERSETNAE